MRSFLVWMTTFLLGLILLTPMAVAANHLHLYRHADFTGKTTHFDPGATVYIKTELDFVPEDEATAKLKRRDGSEVVAVSLDRSDQEATGSIKLPGEAGQYTLEVVLRGQGSEFVASKSLKVDGEENGQNVQISITNIIKSTPPPVYQGEVLGTTEKGGYPGGQQRQVPVFSPLPTSLPQPSPSPAPDGTAITQTPEPVLEASPTPPPSPRPETTQPWWRRLWHSILNKFRTPIRFLHSIGIG